MSALTYRTFRAAEKFNTAPASTRKRRDTLSSMMTTIASMSWPLFKPSSKIGLTDEIVHGIVEFLAGRSDRDIHEVVFTTSRCQGMDGLMLAPVRA